MANLALRAVQSFFQDTLHLLGWSLFQPTKATALEQALYPAPAQHAGLTRQLGLALRSAQARRFLGMQFMLWFLAGLLSSFLIHAAHSAGVSPLRQRLPATN